MQARGAQHVRWRGQRQPRHMSPVPVGRRTSTAGRLELSAEAEGPPRCEEEGPGASCSKTPPPRVWEVDGQGRGMPQEGGGASSKASTQAEGSLRPCPLARCPQPCQGLEEKVAGAAGRTQCARSGVLRWGSLGPRRWVAP